MNAPVKEPVEAVLKPAAKKPGLITPGQLASAKPERWSARRSLLFIFLLSCLLWSPFVAFVWMGGGEWLGRGFAWIGQACVSAWHAIF